MGFEVAEHPTVVTLFGVGRRAGSRNDIVASKDRNSGEVDQKLPIFGPYQPYDREGFLLIETGGAVGGLESGSKE